MIENEGTKKGTFILQIGIFWLFDIFYNTIDNDRLMYYGIINVRKSI